MQAVFLNNKTCERVHPVRIRKDNPDAEPFYEGMDEPLREIHDIWIMQYLRVDGAYFPRIAFEANEDENIEFDSNQESVTMNVYTHIGFDDAEEELKRMEEFRKAQAEGEQKKEKPMSQKMFKVV